MVEGGAQAAGGTGGRDREADAKERTGGVTDVLETPSMNVKAIAPWFGGKRTLAPAIVVELGTHTQYFEPFFGSGAVLFAKMPSQKETVNELSGDLILLARVVQHRES